MWCWYYSRVPSIGDEGNAARRGYVRRLADDVLDDWLRQLPGVLVVGPRACGKTTTARRRARSVVSLDVPGEAAAFRADPDAALRGLEEPVLVDEWQVVPEVLGAIRRSIDADPRPGRFVVTGSVRAALEQEMWAGTGRLTRLTMLPLTQRELRERASGPSWLERLASGRGAPDAVDALDLRDCVELALAGGFPEPALRLRGAARAAWLRGYLDDLLSRDIWALEDSATRRRDPARLRRYVTAYALNAAGVAGHSTIYAGAAVAAKTADAYESLLTDLFAVEQVPAWSSNRLKRLVRNPKRYLVDTGLWGVVLGADSTTVLRDANLLGRLIEGFAVAQLRPEVHALGAQMLHLRSAGGRQEIDLVVELPDSHLIAVEVKAGTAPTRHDARHLEWLREQEGERFLAGVVLHTGHRCFPLGERLLAAPLAGLWA